MSKVEPSNPQLPTVYKLLRPCLFRLDPERAHTFTLYALRFAGALPPLTMALQVLYAAAPKPVTAFGLRFRNPVGLAAGYDKDALAWRGLAALGFGHLELGTVTPLPQPGNPKPRLFRLPEDRGLINRMGFPSRGSAYVAKKLKRAPARRSSVRIGVNLGKNKHTPNEQAVFDYLSLFEIFAPLADYLVINVSSPNTEGLRRLQTRENLENLLTQLAHQRRIEAERLEKRVPILVKLSPDLDDAALDAALEAIVHTWMDGVIVTNTTTSRAGLHSRHARQSGGLSGAPLRRMSTEMVAKVHRRTAGKLPIIAAGGIMSPEDARARLEAGATLIQLYTGLIYAGPGLVKRIVTALP